MGKAMKMISTDMVAEDAKRVERAALLAGKSLSDFIMETLIEACKGASVVTVTSEQGVRI